ncbi:DUF2141 domain-containing protein [Vibrio sp. 10N.261.51.F12]|uniref:DUF2141 domain-containing protein n=1 Tax=Vibrio sp. 10N.261.51.F12 TaxID=3229679 RepID=UPI0035507008
MGRLTIIIGLLFASLSFANAAEVTLKLSGLVAAEGNIRVGFFTDKAKFSEGEYTIGRIIEAPQEGKEVIAKLNDIAPGEYAISVYQDLNLNKSLDKNLFGIPKEPYGFSGNWTSGAAKFEQALIQVDETGTVISISLY